MEKITVILEPNEKNIKKAAKVLELGGIVIYPTESSYAIGGDYTNKETLEEIKQIKKRPKTKKTITIVPDAEMAKKYGKIDEISNALINKFMPGPLTLIVPGKYRRDEFAFRISENPIARKLAKHLGRPITATSANISGEENIYDSEELHKFFGKVDVILDAGDLPKREASTIVKVLKTKIKILREGAISKERLKEFL